MKTLCPDCFIDEIFKKRPDNSNKGTFGRALTFCGSYGMAGASMLACRGALRSGVGLCDSMVDQSIYPICASYNPESIFSVYSDEKEALKLFKDRLSKATACLMGCGSGNTPLTFDAVHYALCHSKIPLVIDADGINAVAEHIDVLRNHSCFTVLTPHPAEMGRLLSVSAEEVQSNREGLAKEFSEEYNVCTVLKGNKTVIAFPDGEIFINPTGNPGMATGGSGDVLAGLTVGFLSRAADYKKAVLGAVYLHSLAGDVAAEELSQTYMLPTDILNALSKVFLKFEKQG